MNRFVLGRHWPGDSFWHRRDPLVKMILAISLIVPAAAAKDFPLLGALAVLACVVWMSACLPFRLLLGALRSFLWLVVLTALSNLLVAPSGGWHHPSPRSIEAGLSLAGLNILRLILLLTFSAWLTGTTSPLSLGRAMGRAVAPLGKLGLPVQDFDLVIGMGLGLLPELLEAGGRIRLAQQARGVGVGHGWRARWRGLEALAVSLFFFAFRRADELALAMEVRGYRQGCVSVGNAGRKLTRTDVLTLLGGLLLTAALTWLGWRY